MTPPQDIMKIAGPDASTNFFGHGISEHVTVPDEPAITQEVIAMAVADPQIGRFDMMMVQGFDAVYTMVQAIQNAQSLDPQVVAAAWAKMTTIDTVLRTWQDGRYADLWHQPQRLRPTAHPES